MKRHYKYLTAGALAALMVACAGEDKPQNTPPVEEESTADQNVGFGFEADLAQNSYAVPSPNEFFSIIKSSELTFKEGLISTEVANYSSSKEQALNFGRLTADIAYTASYEKFQESMMNFENLRKVGNDLGISYVFDELMVNRVKSNMDNPDSLEMISTDSYQSIISMLQENEKGSTLAIIAAGGFVESVYILTNLVESYEGNEEVIQRLADQKLVMENVIDFLNLHSSEPRVQEVRTELQPISDVFLNLDEQVVSEEKQSVEGKTVLGGSKVIMSAAEFEELKKAATNYRNSFSNTNEG